MTIQIRNLRKAYGDLTVLDGLSWDIPEGSATCILGASGQGKTTLLRLMLGLEAPDAGEIRGLEGKRFAAVFQEDRLCDNLSALTNIAMVKPIPERSAQRALREEIRQAMAALGLTGHEDQPVRELSGGMRRRVALLRALTADYDVLFLDEAFKGLDEDSKQAAMAFAKARNAGRTLIMVTHDASEAAALDAEIRTL